MRHKIHRAPMAVASALLLGVFATSCSTEDPTDSTSGTDESSETSESPEASEEEGSGDEQEWFDQAVYDEQFEQRSATFEGDAETPYLQYIDGEMTDTSDLKAKGEQKACFANASISNPWRQTGWITMNQQLKDLQDKGVISEMETRDAGDDDNTQIADIDYFISEGDCDAFIISPNSTAAMTDAVERACETGKPVVVFDRGVQTDCATTFIHPIGGFAWGIDTAEFLIDNLEEGDKVVALRILPGVDVLEQRWAGAEKLFEENGIEAVDYFTGADPTEIKKIITDELGKGDVQGIWMDAGDGAVAAIEAFEDFGADYPVMTGEDEMSFLRKWEETGLTGLAPVYSNFQWRTPLLALA
jgi:ribose transport system substrate-binding protein